jgi:predicted transcriptional regulator
MGCGGVECNIQVWVSGSENDVSIQPVGAGITAEQRALVDRFIAAYNAIDHALRRMLDLPNEVGFSRAVRMQMEQKPTWKDGQALLRYAELRNVLVHEPQVPNGYLSIPVASVVADIEAIRDRLLNPQRVYPAYQRDVVTVAPQDTLDTVLALIKERDYSQFPVYDADVFHGLLTENGITRWLAHHLELLGGMTMVEFDDHRVEHVLATEEARQNIDFVARTALLDEVESLFAHNPTLEAVLITHSGRSSEKPLGIITAFDVSRLGP